MKSRESDHEVGNGTDEIGRQNNRSMFWRGIRLSFFDLDRMDGRESKGRLTGLNQLQQRDNGRGEWGPDGVLCCHGSFFSSLTDRRAGRNGSREGSRRNDDRK